MKKFAVVVCVLIAATLLWLGLRGSESDRQGSRIRSATTAKVERRTIDPAVEAVGEINPANLVTVKPEVSGRIHTIFVASGQPVKKGEMLLTLYDTDLLTERSAALTEIAGAQLQLDKAQRDFQRNHKLYDSKLVSQEAFDNAKTAQEQARNEFEKAGKKLQAVDDKLSKIRIVAPFDGTVLSLFVSKGQVVSGATGMTTGTDLMTFADLTEMLIRAHINQVDVTKLQPGQRVDITVDSIPGVTLEGKVVLIAPIATVKNDIKGFSVDVLITQSDARIRPGMNANLRFPVAHVEQALSVPLAAVFAEGKEKVVYVKTARGADRRPVNVGVSDFNYCEILEGLKEGDVVLLERPASPQPKS